MFMLLFAINTLLICSKVANGAYTDHISNINSEVSRSEDALHNYNELDILNLFKDDSVAFSDESVPEFQQEQSASYEANKVRKHDIIGELIDDKSEIYKPSTKLNDYIDSEYSESRTTEKSRKIQNPFSIKKILAEYKKDEIKLINEFHLAFALLIRKGLKKYFFRKYKPSNIRLMFAKKYSQLFGGSTSSALLKLRDFERKLSLKHSAARKLFSSQLKILEFALKSYKANIHLAEKWRNQPTYVNEPILVINKVSYDKIRSLCKKKKGIDIILITASPENIPKKFGTPDINESYLNIPKLSNIIQSIQNSFNGIDDEITPTFGTTECKWRHSRSKSKSIRSRLLCFHKKKSQFFHMHFYDVKNVFIFSKLIKSTLRHKPNIDTLPTRPLFLIPVLLGIPEINQKGTIIGLNSIKIRKNSKKNKKRKSKKKRRK
ncbi:hypothetical protein FG379_001949 [Cryptosporidium bovis]|uniref:uncharacterized protein n=1 Tax=Cryptosporidium bovis TaxID=310047 RepID=UPI00351A5DB6|nr:hypothetical protein FG379_001949 [Cryptosporidium bovis]